MKITKLEVNHYKSMEDPLVINKFSDLQIIIGPNNAGKTNILDAIYHLFFPKDDPERYYDPNADLTLTVDDSNPIEKIGSNDRKRLIRVQEMPSIEEIQAFKKNYSEKYEEFKEIIISYFPSFKEDKPLRRKGSGLARLYAIFFYLYHPDYDIILIDEAENHLHPSLIKRFLKWLIEKNSKQVFLTTHHPAFVQVESLPFLWQVCRENNNTKIYGFMNSNPKIDMDRLVQEIDDDNSGIFFADKVLLVEGVSDRILMRGLIDRFYQQKCNIKVVQTRSKGNTDIYAQLCDIFHIPYFVMLDEDALRPPWPEIIRKKITGKKKHHEIVTELKKHNIFLLQKDLEASYPRRYQDSKSSKPLNALRASRLITQADMSIPEMKIIKEIIESL
jgi:predicted ATP-dependent endonuclease of OLD family